MTATIFILSRPNFDAEAAADFVAAAGDSWLRSIGASPGEELTEFSGRICYMSFGARQAPRTNQEYIRNLILMGHESVLEHVSWTFLLTGITRGFTHQLVRHRVGVAFSQLSQQYHDETAAEFIEPPELGQFPELQAEWRKAIIATKSVYELLLNRLKDQSRPTTNHLSPKEANRMAHSVARTVLPNATETKIVFTANARALRHILAVRGTIPGDQEMRIVMSRLLEILQRETPALFADFEVVQHSDGLPIVLQKSP